MAGTENIGSTPIAAFDAIMGVYNSPFFKTYVLSFTYTPKYFYL